uniref:Uncharacterized protein n=1 Tax=Panagrolaimus sp. PS1159 TaxID=55785 RepID=A0AC35EY61_9BILA
MSSSESLPLSSSPSSVSMETENSEELYSFFQRQSTEKAIRRRKFSPLKHSTKDSPFFYSNSIVEEHKSVIYAVKFCQFIDGHIIFATVAGPQVTIYKCSDNKNRMEPIAVYKDPHQDEEFYAIEWAVCDVRFEPKIMLIIGGKGALIRTIDPFKGTTYCTLSGHGDVINAISTHPVVNSIIASASKDLTVRLWHCLTKTSLAILGGFAGHRDQILTLDFHRSGNYIASGSMDHTIRVWNISSDPEIRDRISKASQNHPLDYVDPVEIHFSDAESRDLHTNYVDCVQFLGSYIFSKSSENFMVLSKFGEFDDPSPCGRGIRDNKPESLSQQVAKMSLPNCDMWFIKFGLTTGPPGQAWIACGNQKGVVHIWDIHARPIPEKCHYQISDNNFPQVIRKVEFSPNGEIMLVVGDGGKICRCNKKRTFGLKGTTPAAQAKAAETTPDENTQTSSSSIRDSSSAETDL